MIELIKETKVWRVESEETAVELIQEWKDKAVEGGYTVEKSGYVMKTKKSKGQIIEINFIVSIQISYEV